MLKCTLGSFSDDVVSLKFSDFPCKVTTVIGSDKCSLSNLCLDVLLD